MNPTPTYPARRHSLAAIAKLTATERAAYRAEIEAYWRRCDPPPKPKPPRLAAPFTAAAHAARSAIPWHRIGGRAALPYALERNPTRWHHDRFVAVDRNYEPVHDPADGIEPEALAAISEGYWLADCTQARILHFYDDGLTDDERAELAELYARCAALRKES